MAELVEIPKIEFDTPGPGWIATQTSAGQACKPVIKCACGHVTGIGLHHVHADGTVTRSFWHAAVSEFTENGKTYQCTPGCGWHVWLKLEDYAEGDFPPVP